MKTKISKKVWVEVGISLAIATLFAVSIWPEAKASPISQLQAMYTSAPSYFFCPVSIRRENGNIVEFLDCDGGISATSVSVTDLTVADLLTIDNPGGFLAVYPDGGETSVDGGFLPEYGIRFENPVTALSLGIPGNYLIDENDGNWDLFGTDLTINDGTLFVGHNQFYLPDAGEILRWSARSGSPMGSVTIDNGVTGTEAVRFSEADFKNQAIIETQYPDAGQILAIQTDFNEPTAAVTYPFTLDRAGNLILAGSATSVAGTLVAHDYSVYSGYQGATTQAATTIFGTSWSAITSGTVVAGGYTTLAVGGGAGAVNLVVFDETASSAVCTFTGVCNESTGSHVFTSCTSGTGKMTAGHTMDIRQTNSCTSTQPTWNAEATVSN